MAQFIQLTVTVSGAPKGAPADTKDNPEQYTKGLTKNPCIGCPMKELCDEDSCGMHLFDLDIDHDPSYDLSFEEWLTDDEY